MTEKSEYFGIMIIFLFPSILIGLLLIFPVGFVYRALGFTDYTFNIPTFLVGFFFNRKLRSSNGL